MGRRLVWLLAELGRRGGAAFGSSVCACNATGCTAEPNASPVEFDAQLDAGEAKGTLRLPTSSSPRTVYLTKTD